LTDIFPDDSAYRQWQIIRMRTLVHRGDTAPPADGGEMGHHIIFVGRDTKKLDVIKSGKSPIFEPGLDQLLLQNNKKIETTTG